MQLLRRALPLLVVGAILFVGVPAASAVSDSYGGAKFHPFTLAPEGGCVSDPVHRGYGNCDPVNVLFVNKTWQQVQTALMQKGWGTVGFGSTQWEHFDQQNRLFPMNAQLWVQEAGGKQYHIRLWQVPSRTSTLTLGAVHHESTVGLTHVIDMGWDAAELYLANQFCGSSCQKIDLPQQLAEQGGTATWRGWANDAKATIIP